MASDGIQPGQEDAPAFPEEGALASGADLEEVARYAKKRGNLLKGSTTARLEWLAARPSVAGVFWSDTTDGVLYRSDGSGGWDEWARPLVALKLVGGGQDCANNGFTTISWTSVEIETVEMWDSAAPTNIVIPVDGIYRVSANVGFTGAAGGRIALRLRRNGVGQPGGALMPSGGIQEAAPAASTLVALSAGDIFTLQVFQDSGGTRTTSLNDYARPTVALERVGPV